MIGRRESMNRKFVVALLATLLLTNQTAPSSTSSSPNIEAFRQGLRDLGYTEGKNIIIEYRGAGGKFERMPELVAELIGLGVNVIVTTGMPAVIAAKKATSTIPI